MKKTLFFLAALLTFGLAANAQPALSENFNNLADGAVPSGWVTYGDGLTNHYTDATLNDSWSALGGAMVCITWTEEESAVDRWLVTPQINVPISANSRLVFDLAGVNYGAGSPYAESLKVMVSTTDNLKASFSVLYDLGNPPVGSSTQIIDLSTYGGQNIYLAFVAYTNDGMYMYLDNVKVAAIPDNGIAAMGATAAIWTAQNGNCGVNLTVRNEGLNALTSFDVAYTVNNGNEENLSVTGINVAPFQTYTYTFNAAMTELGEGFVNITVSNPNNVADEDESDNSASCATTVYDPTTTTQRTTVLEHFTTAQCGNCPAGHQRLEAAINGREDRVVWIAHHVGYGTDVMTIEDSKQMLAFYNDGGSTYAPASMLDRDHDNATAEDPGPVFFPGSDVSTVLTNALASPAFVTVNITDVSYDAQSRELSLTVSGSFVGDMTFDSPRVSVYIMQDHIRASQSGASGIYDHNHVIRACITDVWGDASAITSTTAGSTFSKTYTYTLPTKMNAKNCWVGAFVNNYATNVNNRRIANGAKTGYLLDGPDPTTGIGDVQAGMSVVTYPNPATEMAYVTAEGTILNYEVVDAMGRKVMAQENVNADILELNVSALAAGIYFVTITTDNGTATQRLNVVK